MKNNSLAPKVVSQDGLPPPGYAAPFLGNGIVGCNVAYTGDLRTVNDLIDSASIWRVGRRFGQAAAYELIPFGSFRLRLEAYGRELGDPTSWEQAIDIATLSVRTVCKYGGTTSDTTVFAPHEMDALVVRNILASPGDNAEISAELEYVLPGYDTPAKHLEATKIVGGYDFAVAGYRFFHGGVRVAKRIARKPDGLHDALVSEWLIVFADDCEGKGGWQESLDHACVSFMKFGAAELLEMNAFAMNGHLRASHREFGNKLYERAWNTAVYNLVSQSTKWSQPVGISNMHWAGRYFAWDEMFAHQGLLAAGLTSLAEKVVNFRRTGLHKARMRVAHYGNTDTFGARFPWETLEDGSDGTPSGFWNDHIFHNANIALCAWTQYDATGDLGYLEDTSFPLILAAARFFLTHAVCRNPDGSVYIGKCTDWERLGPARERGFTTTCGVIYTLERACDAIDALGRRAAFEMEYGVFLETAKGLKRTLPILNGRYVAAANTDQESLGATAGLFPYPVFTQSSKEEVAALLHFAENGQSAGNMYPIGKKMCVWFAGWLACAFFRIGEREKAKAVLDEALTTLGLFGECWEINEPDHSARPWFATASGCLLVALSELQKTGCREFDEEG